MKIQKAIPPAIGSIARRDGKFLLYDCYLTAAGDQKSERKFLNHLSKITNAEAEHNANWTTSEPLGSELLRQIYQIKDPLTLVMTGHLFVENFINHVIEKKFKLSHLILENRDFTFNLKVEILKSKNYLTNSLYFDIKLLNQLRNKFAHRLLFDISNFDMTNFYYFDLAYKLVPFSSTHARRALNIYILRYSLKEILYRLTVKHPTIADIIFKK